MTITQNQKRRWLRSNKIISLWRCRSCNEEKYALALIMVDGSSTAGKNLDYPLQKFHGKAAGCPAILVMNYRLGKGWTLVLWYHWPYLRMEVISSWWILRSFPATGVAVLCLVCVSKDLSSGWSRSWKFCSVGNSKMCWGMGAGHPLS